STLVKMGIDKIRITGGEPFIRKDIMELLHSLSQLSGLRELSITTNGVLTAPIVPELKKLGIHSVNLSLDTLDRTRFLEITHRDELHNVLKTLDALIAHNIEVKINAVVMEGKNTDDIFPLIELTKALPVSVRFIEEMPFNGHSHVYKNIAWNHVNILNFIRERYPDIQKKADPAYSTSYNYQIPGYKGSVGIIAAYTRSFCGSCNRIRLTPEGSLKTCLYDAKGLNVKDLVRQGYSENDLQLSLLNAFNHKVKDGWEAEALRKDKFSEHESMATIGG
ncbi:MAG TPA: radical SAM protein, partial [Segetibacter sp.]